MGLCGEGVGGCLPPLTSLVVCYTSSRKSSAGGSLTLRVKAVVNMTAWVVLWRIESENACQDKRSLLYSVTMRKKAITVAEAGRRGGLATFGKYGRKRMRELGKLGGRPKKKKARK